MDYERVLDQLCALSAPSGFENNAAKAAKGLLEPLMDEVSMDRLGSVLGVRRCGKENAPKLLLDAHLDEIGLMVTGIEKGFLRFCIGDRPSRWVREREWREASPRQAPPRSSRRCGRCKDPRRTYKAASAQ